MDRKTRMEKDFPGIQTNSGITAKGVS